MSSQEPAGRSAAEASHAGSAAPRRDGRRRPRLAIVIAVAACAAVAGTVIAVDSASHAARPAATQRPAPAFTLPSLPDPGQQVSLSAYHGQPVIVNFFASWCPPCKHETPLLAGFYRTSSGGVAIIGVDADDSAPAARQFLAAEHVTYPVGFETTSAVADAWGVSEAGIPETFFLDTRHRIVKRIVGGVTTKELTDSVAMIRPPGGTGRG